MQRSGADDCQNHAPTACPEGVQLRLSVPPSQAAEEHNCLRHAPPASPADGGPSPLLQPGLRPADAAALPQWCLWLPGQRCLPWQAVKQQVERRGSRAAAPAVDHVTAWQYSQVAILSAAVTCLQQFVGIPCNSGQARGCAAAIACLCLQRLNLHLQLLLSLRAPLLTPAHTVIHSDVDRSAEALVDAFNW